MEKPRILWDNNLMMGIVYYAFQEEYNWKISGKL